MRHTLTLGLIAALLGLFGPSVQGQRPAQDAPLWRAWAAALHTQVARFYGQQEQHSEALTHLSQALALLPSSATLHVQRGQFYLLIYEWDAALADFDVAVGLDPDHAPAYFQRGLLHYTRTEREAARDDLQRFLALAPQAREAAQAQAWLATIEAELQALSP